MHEDAIWIIPGSLPLSKVRRGRKMILDEYLGTSRGRRTRNQRDYDTVYYHVVGVEYGRMQQVSQSFDTQETQKTIYDCRRGHHQGNRHCDAADRQVGADHLACGRHRGAGTRFALR